MRPDIRALAVLVRRHPPTWLVALLWAIVLPVFVFRWDYERFSDFLMGWSMGVITTWWLVGWLGRREASDDE